MVRKKVVTGVLIGALLSVTFIPSLVQANDSATSVVVKPSEPPEPTDKPVLPTPKPLLKRSSPPVKQIIQNYTPRRK